MDWQSFFTIVYQWLITTGSKVVIIMILTFIALLIAKTIVNRVMAITTRGQWTEEGKKRADTLGSVVRSVLYIAIWLTSIITILGALGVDIGPVLAAAGVVGLAVGFGAQNLVQDVISGFFILLEDQIRVGDVVEIAGKSGYVEQVNLRMVVLRDLSGNVHYVRNNQIDVVTNMTKEFSYYVFDIGVAYRENVDEVIEAMKEVASDLQADPDYNIDILEDIEVFGLDKFGDSAVIIKARIKTRPIKQWRVGREYNRRLKMAFDARGIEIPFPHRTFYMGQDKTGEALPVRLEISRTGEVNGEK